MDNYMEGDGLLRVEKEKEEEAKRSQKKANSSAKPRAAPGPKKSTAPVREAGPSGKRSKTVTNERTKVRTMDDFLGNNPHPVQRSQTL